MPGHFLTHIWRCLTPWKTSMNNVNLLHWLVIEQDVGALDIPVQEVLLVAVIQSFQQLPHERLDVALVEVHEARLQEAHQVVVHVLKHQVKRPCEMKRIHYANSKRKTSENDGSSPMRYLCRSWSLRRLLCRWRSPSCWWCSCGWAAARSWSPWWLWWGNPPSHCPNGPSLGPPTQLNKQEQKDEVINGLGLH